MKNLKKNFISYIKIDINWREKWSILISRKKDTDRLHIVSEKHWPNNYDVTIGENEVTGSEIWRWDEEDTIKIQNSEQALLLIKRRYSLGMDEGTEEKVKLKVKLSLYFNWVPRHKGVLGSGNRVPRILDLDTRWRWVVSFRAWPLYFRSKSPSCPLDRKLGGPQSRSGRGGEEKNSQPLQGLESPIIQPIAQRYTTELSRLLNLPKNLHNMEA
jgi:hypothetical protein